MSCGWFFPPAPVSVTPRPPGGQRTGAAAEAGGDLLPRRLGRQAGGNGGGHAAGGRERLLRQAVALLRRPLIFSLSLSPRTRAGRCSCAQVCANIMEYCQTLLLHSSAQAQFSICLFSPSGSEPGGRDGGRAGQRPRFQSDVGLLFSPFFRRLRIPEPLWFPQTCPLPCPPWPTPGRPAWAWSCTC